MQTETAKTFYINGTFSGKTTKTILLTYIDANGEKVKQECSINKGKFTFSGLLTEPVWATLQGDLDTSNWVNDPNGVNIFIEPQKMNISVEENNFKLIKVTGSATQRQYDALKERESPIEKQMQPLTAASQRLADSIHFFLKRKDTVSAYKAVQKRDSLIHIDMKPYKDEINSIEKLFIANNPDSYLSAYLLYHQFSNHYLPNDSVWFYFNRFPAYIQNSYWGKETRIWLGNILPVGSTFPIIKGVNDNDKIITTDDILKNAGYTLVIFWASWCIPCRQLNPVYARIYNEYHSKGLKFIAITLDDDKKRWTDAIQKDCTSNWAHIFPSATRTTISDIYGLYSIPAEILLKGDTVIAKYAGADNDKSSIEDLENKLKEIYR